MKKRMLAILLCLCMAVAWLPGTARAEEEGNPPDDEAILSSAESVTSNADDGLVETDKDDDLVETNANDLIETYAENDLGRTYEEDGWVTNYTELQKALAENSPSTICIRPAPDFGWPAEATSVVINDRAVIVDGIWTIPSNVTLTFNKSCIINPNGDAASNPTTSRIDLSGTILVDKTAVIEGDIGTAGNTAEVYCDVTIRSGATFEIKMPDGVQNYSFLRTYSGRTWTVDAGANLKVDVIMLCGTLTGTGTVDAQIEVEPGYNYYGDNSTRTSTNAVLSGSLTFTDRIRIAGDLNQPSSGATSTVTIPEGSTINFVSKKQRTQNDDPEQYGYLYTEIAVDSGATLNINGTLKMSLLESEDDHKYNGKNVLTWPSAVDADSTGHITLGSAGKLDISYPCQIWWMPPEANTQSPVIDGAGTVQFHHTVSGELRLPPRDSSDQNEMDTYRDFFYRANVTSGIKNRDKSSVFGANVKVQYDWDCEGTHNYLLEESQEPTCTEGGMKQWICSGCMERKNEWSDPLGHNMSTTPDSDGKYHCQNAGCDVATDAAPVKLPTPTDLKWGVIRHLANEADSRPYPGAISWARAEGEETETHEHEYEIKVYKKGSNGDTLVWSRNAGTYRDDAPEYKYYSVVAFGEEIDASGAGEYYFTIQYKASRYTSADLPCYCITSDIATSESWAYTPPAAKLPTPTGLTWDGSMAKWTANTVNDPNSYYYIVNFYYSATDGNATSTENLLLRGEGGGSQDGSCAPGEWTIREEGYYYFTVKAVSDDISSLANSDVSALSPAFHYVEGSTHLHDWDTSKWVSDSTHHWHACKDASCTVRNDYNPHTYDHGVCYYCGYDSSTTGPVTPPVTTDPVNPPVIDDPVYYPPSAPTSGTSNTTPTTNTTPNTEPQTPVTTTTTDSHGTVTETTTNPDGSSVAVVTQPDGATATVATSASGQVTASVSLPATAVSAAQSSGEAVTLPIPAVSATRNTASAPVVTVTTGSSQPVKVEIPAAAPTPGTVAVLVKADGTEEVIKASVPTADGVAVSLPDGATVKIVDNSKDFADVSPAHWAEDAVDFVTARELFSGTSETAFTPEAPMTRAMLVTVLARLDGADTSGGETWYEKGVEWAIAHDISDGSNPSGNITREQLAVMLWRYAGSPAASGSLGGFTDAGKVNGYAQEAMRWAVSSGIINGLGDGQLAPQGQATRAQVAQMLKNFMESK